MWVPGMSRGFHFCQLAPRQSYATMLWSLYRAINFHSSAHLRWVGFVLGWLKLIKHSSSWTSKIYFEQKHFITSKATSTNSSSAQTANDKQPETKLPHLPVVESDDNAWQYCKELHSLFLSTSGFYVRATRICKEIVSWTRKVKRKFFVLLEGWVPTP